jgi:hypothetical protein
MAQLENDTLAAARARLDKMNQEKAAALAQMAQVGKEMNEQVRSIRLLAADDWQYWWISKIALLLKEDAEDIRSSEDEDEEEMESEDQDEGGVEMEAEVEHEDQDEEMEGEAQDEEEKESASDSVTSTVMTMRNQPSAQSAATSTMRQLTTTSPGIHLPANHPHFRRSSTKDQDEVGVEMEMEVEEEVERENESHWSCVSADGQEDEVEEEVNVEVEEEVEHEVESHWSCISADGHMWQSLTSDATWLTDHKHQYPNIARTESIALQLNTTNAHSDALILSDSHHLTSFHVHSLSWLHSLSPSPSSSHC